MPAMSTNTKSPQFGRSEYESDNLSNLAVNLVDQNENVLINTTFVYEEETKEDQNDPYQ